MKEGRIIEIRGEKYQVVSVQEEAEIVKPGKPVKKFKAFYLHKIESESLFPTHVLHSYPNKSLLFELKQEGKHGQVVSLSGKRKIRFNVLEHGEENKFNKSIAEWYDKIISAGYYENEKIVDSLVAILGNRKKILEIGIGTGLIAEDLVTKGYEISGFDLTKEMLDKARKKLSNKVKLYEQNVTKLKLPEKYEAAFSQGGPFYATKDEKNNIFLESSVPEFKQCVIGMKNISNCLVKSGLLIIGIQKAHKSFEGLKLVDGAIYSQKVEYKLPYIDKEYFVFQDGKRVVYDKYRLRRFTEEEKSKMMEEAGFIGVGEDKTKNFLVYKKV